MIAKSERSFGSRVPVPLLLTVSSLLFVVVSRDLPLFWGRGDRLSITHFLCIEPRIRFMHISLCKASFQFFCIFEKGRAAEAGMQNTKLFIFFIYHIVLRVLFASNRRSRGILFWKQKKEFCRKRDKFHISSWCINLLFMLSCIMFQV